MKRKDLIFAEGNVIAAFDHLSVALEDMEEAFAICKRVAMGFCS
jgi:hypothetical protein